MKSTTYIQVQKMLQVRYTQFNRDISIQTSSLPIKFFIVGTCDWLRCGLIERTLYVLTLTLCVLYLYINYVVPYSSYFTIYQQHCYIVLHI
jgi:hypothetical protein